MDKITRNEIKEIPITPYLHVFDTLQTGDLLFASGNYSISRAIQVSSKSPWSHIGIVYKDENINRRLILESVEDDGVRLVALSKYLVDYEKDLAYKGFLVLARMQNILTQEQKKEIISTGFSLLSSKYDYIEIMKIVYRILFNKKGNEYNEKFICSELVETCFKRANINFLYDELGFITPEHIWEDPRLRLVARIL